MNFASNSRSTTFTISSGGTGSGTFTYSKNNKKAYWFFTDGMTITGSPLVLVYADATVPGDVTLSQYSDSSDAPSATKPVSIKSTGADHPYSSRLYYETLTYTSTTNTYVVTYPTAGVFNIAVTKDGVISTKVLLYNGTSHTLDVEPTFNSNDYSYAGVFNGLGINITLQSGAYSDHIINSTGFPGAPPYGVGGSRSGQMNFDTIQPYLKGYFGVNITMNATTFDSNKRYFIDVFDPSGKEKAGFPIEISSASYITGRNWVFSDLGLWNATLTDCSQFNFLCGATGFSGLPPSYQQLIDCVNNPLCGTRSHLVDVAVQVINASEYTYTITSEATKYATNDTIHFNITSTNPVGAYFTILDSLGNVVNPLANNVLVGEGVTLYNVTIPNTIQNGNYTAILALNTGYYAQVKAYQFSIGIVPGRDSISWGDNNIFGYTNTLSWSNGNWTNYITISKLLNGTLTQTDNFSINNLSVSSKPYLMDTVGFWSAKLYNTTSGTAKYANMSVFSSSVGLCDTKLDDFVCFNNQSYFPGDTYTINYQAKSLPNSLLSGYYIDPYSKVVVKVVNPNGITVFNKTISDCTGTILGSPVQCPVNIPLIGSLTSKFKVSDAPGTYQVLIVYDKRDLRTSSEIIIEDVLASNTAVLVSKPITTPAPPTGQQGTTAMGNNLLSFMYVPAFWGVIIWFAVVVISASSGARNSMSNTGVVAITAALLESVVGLFDPYRWFVLAGIIIIAGIYFTIGRKITSGE